MKKIYKILLLVVFSLILCSCAKKVVYVNENGEVIQNPYGSKATDYFNLKKIAYTEGEVIYVDTYTDVLYYLYTPHIDKGAMTPIMKADGTCLTYTEWKTREHE